MITYQVKINIDPTVEEEWLKWMKTVHVPDVIATGLVRSFQILQPESVDQIYVFHYQFDSKADFEIYKKDFAPELKEDVIKRYPDLFTGEREIYHWI